MQKLRACLLAALLSLTATPAFAQNFPQTLPTNTVYGRVGTGSGPGQAIPFAVLAQRLRDTTGTREFNAVDYGVVCDGVTDNVAAFARVTVAIGSSQSARIVLPPGRCMTTAWSLAGKSNLIIEGSGGADITELVPGTQLTCTQTGSTTCFDWSNTRGIVLRDTTVCYSSGTFSGVLMSLAHSTSTWSNYRFDNVQFKQCGTTTHSALALLYVNNVVQWMGTKVIFEHAQNGIVGGFNGESGFENTTLISCFGCTFQLFSNAAVLNPGTEWTFDGSWFAPDNDGSGGNYGTPRGILQSDTSYTVLGLTINGTSFTDGTKGGSWITLQNVRGFKMSGGSMGGNSTVNQIGIETVLTGEGIDVSGVYFAFLEIGMKVRGTINGLHIHGNNTSTSTTGCDIVATASNFVGEANGSATCNNFVMGTGKKLTVNNTMTFAAGADSNTYTFSSISGTVASLNTAQAWTNVQTFGAGNLVINGATSGSTDVRAPTTGGGTATFFTGTDTVVGVAATQALTNKTYNGNTWTAGTGVLTIAAGKTLTANNTLAFSGTDSTTMTFPSTSATVAGLEIANVFTALQNLTFSQNAASYWRVTNTNTGTSASAQLQAISNSGTFALGAFNNPNGGGNANVTWSGASSMVFASTNAAGTVAFQSGGFNTRLFVHASGAVTIGSSGTDLGGTGRILADDYVSTTAKTVATLSTCNAAAKGARSFVTDANATFTAGIGAVVAAGGANNVPVTCDGTNWRIGANDNFQMAKAA